MILDGWDVLIEYIWYLWKSSLRVGLDGVVLSLREACEADNLNQPIFQ